MQTKNNADSDQTLHIAVSDLYLLLKVAQCFLLGVLGTVDSEIFA